jgi:TetR/AcrR family transcriptional regulator
MARGRAANYDDQRGLILTCAAALFAERGYMATSMNQVAEAAGMSKATLYHYYRDKYALLLHIADDHVSRLQTLVAQVQAEQLPARPRLQRLIERFVEAYADARHAHRVLTEDVRFLEPDDRRTVLGKERDVVAAFADTVAELRPEADAAHWSKPLTMLLFGMINWMFTWVRPDGRLDHETLAPVVADLFLNGLGAVHLAPLAPASDDAAPSLEQPTHTWPS